VGDEVNGEDCIKQIGQCYIHDAYMKQTDVGDNYCDLHLPGITDPIECPLLVREHPLTGYKANGDEIKDENRWVCGRGEKTTPQLVQLHAGLKR
jgi:hypothetical protein